MVGKRHSREIAIMRSSKISHECPVSGIIGYWIARLWLWVFGWKIAGEVPVGRKFVVIMAPHTSNWDFPFALAVGYIFRIRSSWMGKHTIFKWPSGILMRYLGGIPINRSIHSGVVEQIARRITDADRIVVTLSPPGTRHKRDYWKSGFYWIAVAAKVPIICAYLDYPRKEAGIGLCIVPGGDLRSDMDRIRGFYEGIQGQHPESMSRIRLREEDGERDR